MSDEYIKKEDAIEWFQGMLDHDGSDYDIGVGGCIAAVKRRIPSADVVPVRHGRWMPTDRYGFPFWECSGCGMKTDMSNLPYCPNCGARMDGENDE